MGYRFNEQLCKFNSVRCWTVEAIACLYLAECCSVHEFMTVAQNDRSPSTHEINIAVAVYIRNMSAFARSKILRISLWKRRCALMAPHAVRDHAFGACTKLCVWIVFAQGLG